MVLPVLQSGYSLTVTNGVASSITLTAATNITVGDLLLIFVMDDADNETTRLFETPAGYNYITQRGNSTVDTWVVAYWKIAESGDIDTDVTVSHSSVSDELMGWQLRVIGAHASAPIHITGAGTSVVTKALNISASSSSIDGCLFIYGQSFDGGDGYPFSQSQTGWSQIAHGQENTDSNTVSGSFGTKPMATAGDPLNPIVNASTVDGMSGIVFAIAPAVLTEHDLLADDIQSTSEVSTPVFTQENALLADDVQSTSELSTPVFTQENALLADDIQSTSEISIPAVSESNILLANDVQSTSELSTPVFTQENALLADDVQSTSELSTPVLATCPFITLISDVIDGTLDLNQDGSFTYTPSGLPPYVDNFTYQITDINGPSNTATVTLNVLDDNNDLLADDVSSNSEVSTPIIGQIHGLISVNVQSTSEISIPAVSESNILLADDVQSTSEVSTPVLVHLIGTDALLADDIQSTSEVSTPVFTQENALLADDVQSTSELSTPVFTQENALLADDVQSTSEVSTPVFIQNHSLAANDAECNSEVSTPVLIEIAGVHDLLTDDVSSNSEVSTPDIGQIHGLISVGVESISNGSNPLLGQIHSLAANDIQALSELSITSLNSVIIRDTLIFPLTMSRNQTLGLTMVRKLENDISITRVSKKDLSLITTIKNEIKL